MFPTYLEHLSDADLIARLAKIEEMGKKTAALVAKGIKGDAVTTRVIRGRHCSVGRYEHALNAQRAAWKNTKTEMLRRGI